MLLLLLVVSALGLNEEPCPTPSIYTFDEFVVRYKKTYNANELAFRKEIFDSNVTKLLQDPCCTCGITKFYDQTQHEILGIFDAIQPIGDSTCR